MTCFYVSCAWFYWYFCALAMEQYVYRTMGSEKYKSCGIFLLCVNI